MRHRAVMSFLAVVTGLAAAACSSSSSGRTSTTAGGAPSTSASSTTSAAACSPGSLQTVSPGAITIGVDNPVYPPWFNDDKTPIDGNGFESAVDLAIAKALGYTSSQIKLRRVTFDQAIGPAARDFDFDLDEFSITPEREKAVDFSTPYYDVAEAIVALKGTEGAKATTLADVRQLKLGAQSGTTDQQTITNVIKPARSAFYGSNSLAVQALKNGQIDGLVVDLPTAFYVTGAQVSGSVIVGQLPPSGSPEQFGALLAKGSPLTACVSQAIDQLKSRGELATIQTKWLAQEGDAPVLH